MRHLRSLCYLASLFFNLCFLLSGTEAHDQGQRCPVTERITVTVVSTLHLTTTKVVPPWVSTTTKTVSQCSSSPRVSTTTSSLPASTVTKTVTSGTGTCSTSGQRQYASSCSAWSASTITVTSVHSLTCPSLASASSCSYSSTSTCPTVAPSTVTTTSVQTTTLTVTTSATASTCPQLVENPSFESGSILPWINANNNFGLSFETAASSAIPGGAHSGLFAAGFFSNGGPLEPGSPADASLDINAPPLCSSSQQYQFLAYVKTAANTCYVNFYDNGSGTPFIDIHLPAGGAEPPWVEMSAVITPGASFQLTFEVACSTGDPVWVDDITLTPI